MASVVVSGIVSALHNLFPAIPLSPVDASGGLGAMFDTAQATFGIVDSGSNSNGSYVKFADGTMICTGASSAAVTTSLGGPWGTSPYFSALQSFPYPANFVGTTPPQPVFQAAAGVGTPWIGYSINAATTGCQAYLYGHAATDSAYMVYTVVGKWK